MADMTHGLGEKSTESGRETELNSLKPMGEDPMGQYEEELGEESENEWDGDGEDLLMEVAEPAEEWSTSSRGRDSENELPASASYYKVYQWLVVC